MSFLRHTLNREWNKWLFVAFTIGLFSITLHVNAQAPGFLGKRFMIGLEASTFANPGLFQEKEPYYTISSSGNIQTDYDKYSTFNFRIKPSLNIEYVLNRKTSIQAFVKYYSKAVDAEIYRDTIHEYGEAVFVDFYPTERIKMNAISFGGKFKFFGRDHINPVGSYWSVGMEYVLQTLAYSDQNFQAYASSKGGVFSRNPYASKSSNLIFTTGFGKQYAVSHKLLMNLGLELGVPLTNYWSIDKNSQDPKAYPDRTTANDILGAYILNINIGLSLIP
ncbi:hypothetical protein KFE94_10165 [bacterium SCSIO 12643]|nr:hypothetical protein KFE94_10165 [bacterium SCSIO 12643]